MRKLINMLGRNRARMEKDLDRELRYHLERRTDVLISSGLSATQARKQAAIELGGAAQVKEAVRDTWFWRWLHDLLRDVRYGIRAMGRNPGFTAAAVLTLTLGIGVNVTLFSFVNALLLRPLPVPNSHRIIAIYTSDYSGPPHGGSSYPDYIDFRDASDVFSGMSAYSIEMMSLSSGSATERVLGNIVTKNYFSVLGVDAVRGRTLSAEGDDAVVLSYGLWQRAFASDPGIVGRNIVVNGRACRVAGVAPKGFRGLVRGIPADLWVPLESHPGTPAANQMASRSNRGLEVVGRLADGVELRQAKAAFRAIAGRMLRAHPEEWTDIQKQGRRITLLPANEALMIDRTAVVQFLTILMAVVGIVLLLACVNVANLLLARASARTKELSIRLSLGAGRLLFNGPASTESLLLSSAAGAAGILLAIWAT
ncbi:MAG: FtsX-like permease family protein, partial [Chloroflexota bacterium]